MPSYKDLSAKQLRAVDRLYEHDLTMLVAGTGEGKTIISLTAIQELIDEGHLKRVAVVCPNKVMKGWPYQARIWDHINLKVDIIYGTRAARVKRINESEADVLVISTDNFNTFAAETHGCDGVVVDEITKSCGSKTSTLRTKKGDCFKWRVGMTATPVSKDFIKLFKMARVLDKGAALGRNEQKFLYKYFMPDYNGYKWELLAGSDRLILKEVGHLIHIMKDEKKDELPPFEDKVVRFPMPESTRPIYANMKKEFIADGIEAVNAAVQSGKLRQIASGFLYPEDSFGGPVVYDTARAEAALDWVDELRGAKGIIFYEYDQQMRALLEVLPDAEFIYGGLNTKLVDKALERFKADSQVLCAQINSMSHGVDGLQRVCCNGLFFHPMWSRDATEQAKGRLWRTGQTSKVNFTTLVCEGTLDELVVNRVEDQAKFMKMFREHLKEN